MVRVSGWWTGTYTGQAPLQLHANYSPIVIITASSQQVSEIPLIHWQFILCRMRCEIHWGVSAEFNTGFIHLKSDAFVNLPMCLTHRPAMRLVAERFCPINLILSLPYLHHWLSSFNLSFVHITSNAYPYSITGGWMRAAISPRLTYKLPPSLLKTGCHSPTNHVNHNVSQSERCLLRTMISYVKTVPTT